MCTAWRSECSQEGLRKRRGFSQVPPLHTHCTLISHPFSTHILCLFHSCSMLSPVLLHVSPSPAPRNSHSSRPALHVPWPLHANQLTVLKSHATWCLWGVPAYDQRGEVMGARYMHDANYVNIRHADGTEVSSWSRSMVHAASVCRIKRIKRSRATILVEKGSCCHPRLVQRHWKGNPDWVAGMSLTERV